MVEDQLRLYRALSRAPFPKSYVGKVFFTAFLGTHVPLLALLFYFVRRRRFGLGGALRILSVTVPATLGGTAFTLWAMYALSAPTALASRALRRYLDSGELPELPVGYTDRAGRLMADVQYTVERLDTAVRSLEELATRDHLTGAYNRRAAEERIAEDLKRVARGGGMLSLALFDLDHLKSINDEHGHRGGDACVIRFAEVLERNLRAGTGSQGGGRRVRGGHVEHARTADGAGTGAHRRGLARESRGVARRRRGAPHLQRGGVPVENGGRCPRSGLEGRRSPLPGQGRGREYHRTPRLELFAKRS